MSADSIHFPPLALYVHLPWCIKKCPYCDFNSHVLRGALAEKEYLTALLRDLEWESNNLEPRPLQSIFFGGGTPSLFSPQAISAVMAKAAALFGFTDNIEITLEANPGTADSSNFKGYRAAGVNRLSLGIQSFVDESLQRIGRIHDGVAASKAIVMARDCGFDNLNLDLMYGLPEQTKVQVQQDVETALAYEPEHISAYQLTLEPNTAFHRKPPKLPSHDEIVEIESAVHDLLQLAGYRRYEISAFARPGEICRHNVNYWRFGDYIGIGAGAHGKHTTIDQIIRRKKRKSPQGFMQKAGTDDAITEKRVLQTDDLVFEYMLNGLRLTNGFSIYEFEQNTRLSIDHILPIVDLAKRKGWLKSDDGFIRPTDEGLRFLNDLQMLFLPESSAEVQLG